MNDDTPTFEGFDEPTQNWTKFPNVLIRELPRISSLGELKVILYVLRHTWGFHETEKRISLDEFQYGRKRRGGSRLDSGIGMGLSAIRRGIARAVEHGYLIMREDARDKGRIKRYYQLNMIEVNSQGYQNDTPGVLKEDPRVIERKPRTWKETLETNRSNFYFLLH